VNIFQKSILSFLISLILFAGIAVLAFTGFFDLVEARFYLPSITRSQVRETARDAEVIENLLADLQSGFAGSLNELPVRRSFLSAQNAGDIFERSRIYGLLLESAQGLQSVRFVDAAGVEIHFSTYAPDIISQDASAVLYRHYGDDPGSLSFEMVHVPDKGGRKLTMDNARDRIVFSFPFYDFMDAYRGTALFTVSVRALAGRLVSAGRIKVSDNIVVINSPPGIISGIPETADAEIIAAVSSIWDSGLLGPTPFDSTVSGHSLALVSAKTSQGVFYGRLINEELFSFPGPLKALLLLSTFLTLFLTVFFCFNVRPDTATIIQDRLKNIELSLLEQLYEHKGDMDWARWTMELEQRRKGVHAEVKRGIRFGRHGFSGPDVDSLIDTSWDELLTLIGAREKSPAAIDEEKLQSILNRLLQNLPTAARPTPEVEDTGAAQDKIPASFIPAGMETPTSFEDISSVENISLLETEEIEEAEELEEIAEAEKQTAAPEQRPRKYGGLLAAAIAKLRQEAEEAEEIEELEQVEELEELEQAEELEELAEGGSGTDAPPLAGRRPSVKDIKKLESMIEFGSSPSAGADEGAEDINKEVEIVSPFASMLSSLDDAGEPEPLLKVAPQGKTKKNPAEGADPSGAHDNPLLYRSFLAEADREPELLHSPEPEGPPGTAILEQDGIHYVNSKILNTDDGADKKMKSSLDSDFQELVDTVTKNPSLD
jgi:hypothetical protein